MSENEEVPDVPKLYKYYLVEFVHRGRRRRVEQIDIVPSSRLSYDIRSKRPITKFLQQPYADEDILMLHSLIKSCAVPPEDWPTFPVHIKAKADSYEEAMDKLDNLKTDSHALTLESEESFSTAQMKINDALRQRDFQKQAASLIQEIADENSNSDSCKDSSGDEAHHENKKRKRMTKKQKSNNPKLSSTIKKKTEVGHSIFKNLHAASVLSEPSTSPRPDHQD